MKYKDGGDNSLKLVSVLRPVCHASLTLQSNFSGDSKPAYAFEIPCHSLSLCTAHKQFKIVNIFLVISCLFCLLSFQLEKALSKKLEDFEGMSCV